MPNHQFSLTPHDMGFDLRAHPDMEVVLPAAALYRCQYVDRKGSRRFIAGPAGRIVPRLRASGYRVRVEA